MPRAAKRSQGPERLSPARRGAISALLLLYIFASLLQIARARIDWPFSSYPMYSEVNTGWYRKAYVYAVTAEGERPLRDEECLQPLGCDGMVATLQRLSTWTYRHRRDRVLEYLTERYAEPGPGRFPVGGLLGLRVYRVEFRLKHGAPNRGEPDSLILVVDYPLPPGR